MSQMNLDAMTLVNDRVWYSVYDFTKVNNGYAMNPVIGTIDNLPAGKYVGSIRSDGTYEQSWTSSNDLYGSRAVALGAFKYDVVDRITGSKGSDILYGGWGDKDDYIGGGTYFHDTVNGGNDVIFGGGGDNGISTYAGNDLIVAGWDLATDPGSGVNFLNTWVTLLNNNTFRSSFKDRGGDNNISTGIGNDTVVTGYGNDTIYTGSDLTGPPTPDDDDRVYAGDGQDSVHGGYGYDTLYGEGGNDTLYGEGNNDLLFGGTGDDALIGGDGHDQLDGEENNDTLNGGTGNDTLYGGDGNDKFFGGDDNDKLFGDAGNDTLNGDAGNDSLLGGTGADILDGGAGIDLVSYETSAGPVKVRLNVLNSDGYAVGDLSDAAGDQLKGIENLMGSAHGDLFIGEESDNIIDGGAGNDEIAGDGGNDTLWGGLGNDTLAGNSGVDHLLGGASDDYYVFGTGSSVDFVYENANEGTDYAYLVGLTSIGVYKNGNDLWLAMSNDDVMVLADWYLTGSIEYIYDETANVLYATADVAQSAVDITPTVAGMLMSNANMQDVPSFINAELQLNPDIIALAGAATVPPVELA